MPEAVTQHLSFVIHETAFGELLVSQGTTVGDARSKVLVSIVSLQ